ncbi:phosphotransferase [Phenylobacterium sp.]|uniref:phosphotransferase n=1 Tax=Phenylobacterium sp. TaxID=1871053 RepID=UPI0027325051|nr:phosphotransferase [Phenylobacterium sp.]MDP3852696.1 phosphotransferase [Phenylobacterium sp.]
MSKDPFEIIAKSHRDSARSALAALGSAPIKTIDPVYGGASGASIFRVEAGGERFLMRVEGPASPLLPRNPHRHACTHLAADAGVAPAVHYLDETSGVVVTDFVEQRPLHSFPGGASALARAVGDLLRRLQTAPAFPQLVYYPDLLTRMLGRLREAGIFASGLLDEHVARLATIRAVLDRETTSLVSSHNDPHSGNILFDGARLWLIDWEAAYRNHPLVDVAIALDNLAASPDLEDALLGAWLGRRADEEIRAQLALVRPLTRLYYACFLLNAAATEPQATAGDDLSSPSIGEFQQALLDGRLKPNTPKAMHRLGKMYLNGFLTGAPTPALSVA